MADATYTPLYPQGWEDRPSLDTPIDAAALNNIDAGILAAIAQSNLALRAASAMVPAFQPNTAYPAGAIVAGPAGSTLAGQLLQAKVTFTSAANINAGDWNVVASLSALFAASDLSNVTPATGRNALGLGSASTHPATDFATPTSLAAAIAALSGVYQPLVVDTGWGAAVA